VQTSGSWLSERAELLPWSISAHQCRHSISRCPLQL
jgi:hypothetical protein